MNFEPSSKKKSPTVSKTYNFKREEAKVKKEYSKDKVIEEFKKQSK